MTTDNKALADRYRKKPVVIEAMQFDGTADSAGAICRWANADDAAKGHDDPTVSFITRDDQPGKAFDMLIWTLEGDMTASPGDWIIRGVQGEHYPCKPDIFSATYEPAAPSPQADKARGEGLDYVPGELDRTAPARIWLQIDTSGDNAERDEAWPGADHVTWQDEEIGGLEIAYVRADLAAPQPQGDASPERMIHEACGDPSFVEWAEHRARDATPEVCQTCNGHGMVDTSSGQTPDNYCQDAMDCPDCTPQARPSNAELLGGPNCRRIGDYVVTIDGTSIVVSKGRRLVIAHEDSEQARPDGGEAVGFVDDGVMTRGPNDPAGPGRYISCARMSRELPAGTKLYTHPAPAPDVALVDDAMVKRAEDYYYDNAPANGPAELRELLRGCLTTAQQEGSSHEA
ncbi:hypothetical protein [Novilysobacter erysipheiresistens]|uniref:Uncharacterized protein n=1 Tax=Novilysobacter erysipheiresistens TaxID=1749332 RepID=A0ABU7YUA6_9GAMM